MLKLLDFHYLDRCIESRKNFGTTNPLISHLLSNEQTHLNSRVLTDRFYASINEIENNGLCTFNCPFEIEKKYINPFLLTKGKETIKKSTSYQTCDFEEDDRNNLIDFRNSNLNPTSNLQFITEKELIHSNSNDHYHAKRMNVFLQQLHYKRNAEKIKKGKRQLREQNLKMLPRVVSPYIVNLIAEYNEYNFTLNIFKQTIASLQAQDKLKIVAGSIQSRNNFDNYIYGLTLKDILIDMREIKSEMVSLILPHKLFHTNKSVRLNKSVLLANFLLYFFQNDTSVQENGETFKSLTFRIKQFDNLKKDQLLRTFFESPPSYHDYVSDKTAVELKYEYFLKRLILLQRVIIVFYALKYSTLKNLKIQRIDYEPLFEIRKTTWRENCINYIFLIDTLYYLEKENKFYIVQSRDNVILSFNDVFDVFYYFISKV